MKCLFVLYNVYCRSFFQNFYDQKLDWREYSFLDNPKVPDYIRNSHINIGVEGFGNKKDFDISIPKMASDAMISMTLGQLKNVRVLELHMAPEAFCGFDDTQKMDVFNRKMNSALTASCFYCLTNNEKDKPAKYEWKYGRDCAVGFDLPPPLQCKS